MALKLILGSKDWDTWVQKINYMDSNDIFFNQIFKKEWTKDPFVLRALKGIDNVEPVLDGSIFHNLVSGDYHTSKELSTGCKTILLIYFRPNMVFRARYGNNCLPYLEEIASQRDVIVHDYYFHFYDHNKIGPVELLNYDSKKIGSKAEMQDFYKTVYLPYENNELDDD